MSKCSNYLPSNDQLAALTKGRVPKNTIKNTEVGPKREFWDKNRYCIQEGF